jgi:hypothetical protein
MKPGHGGGGARSTADGEEEDGGLRPALPELDSVGGLSECATARRGYTCEELG